MGNAIKFTNDGLVQARAGLLTDKDLAAMARLPSPILHRHMETELRSWMEVSEKQDRDSSHCTTDSLPAVKLLFSVSDTGIGKMLRHVSPQTPHVTYLLALAETLWKLSVVLTMNLQLQPSSHPRMIQFLQSLS